MLAEHGLENIGAHEATLASVTHQTDVVVLSLDDVFAAGERVRADVTIRGVRSVLRDGSPVPTLRMEESDGEVLSLLEDDGRVVLAVQWNDFAARRQFTTVYTLVGGTARIRVVPPA